jgi:hypothetical protein
MKVIIFMLDVVVDSPDMYAPYDARSTAMNIQKIQKS